jgi:glutamine transport system permease protein
MEWSLMWSSVPFLLQGALMTVKITAISVSFGILIGTFVGMARISKNKIIFGLASIYVDFIRGTPLLVQIFLVHMGLPQILGFPIPPFVSAISAMSINSGAYVAEIVRAGIQSIDKGQMEAARSLGMTYSQAMKHVILPQAFRRIIPPLGNEFIAMLKDSSLVSVIALEELVRKGQIVIGRTFRPFELWIDVAILFLVMTIAISRFINWTEKRLHVGESAR